jgi:hypothetical protein
MRKSCRRLANVLALTGFAVCSFAWRANAQENMTPLLLAVQNAPVPFTGSDGRVHLVYELWLSNFSSAAAGVAKVDVLGDGTVLQTLDAAAIAKRLQPAGQRDSGATLSKGALALLFLNVSLAPDETIPRELSHRVTAHLSAAPPGHQEITETGGATVIDRQPVARISPPLRSDGYISADSCCDATRHTRAALPVNGRVWVAQRYAVDWEQLDANSRIYSGPREKLESYAIFGKPVFAVADATVVSVTDGQPEQTPGAYPTNISLDAADGNSIILDLGQKRYALYAHLQPGSIKVHRGETVKSGQVIGLVGDTGNSVVPHLHFQVMDSPASLGANGLPYEIDDFEVAGQTHGTEAFDEAETKGTPLVITAASPVGHIKNALPLDQLIISFPTR